ncbi:MAG: peptidoglycan DD-metalloendopeptidase family protein [Desulfuromonadales bacterium]|nr:peptidoglycan DD-metalloendopeptidase family protein [Desulfuromonadales bacterium]
MPGHCRPLISRLLPLALFLWLLPPLAAAADNPEQTRKSLQDIEQRIEQTTRTLGEKKAQAQGLDEDLQLVAREEARLQKRISTLEREAAGLEAQRKQKLAEVTALKGQTERTERLVRRRLVALYKGGELGPMRTLFAAVSPARMAEDYEFLGRIVRRDRELLNGYRQQVADLEQAQQQLAGLHQKQQVAMAELQQERRGLRQAARLKEKLLVQVRQDEASLAQLLGDLRERAKRLGSLLKRLESEKPRAYTSSDGPFARQQGRLLWPIEGAVRIGFGTSRHPDLGTLHDSQGIEIAAPPDQPVAAVWPGRVVFASAFKGFGNLLILDHGDGFYTLYAQASRLTRRVGDQVQGGEVLAFTGYEGSRGFYFEVRHHGVPQNPAIWLRSR